MKKFFMFILLLLFVVLPKIHAEEFEFIYTDWFDYFPDDVDSFRIQSEDRYKWYIINDNGDYEETDDYYSELEGYIRIDDSLKTFYRVINTDYVVFDNNGNLVYDLNKCIKRFCMKIQLEKYEIHEEEEETPIEPHEEIIINPDTYDGIYNYYILFTISTVLLIIILKNKSSYVESL